MANGVLLIHLIAVSLWGGVVAAEVVLELGERREPDAGQFVARAHYWIDLVLELPVVLVVAATGIVMSVGRGSLPPGYWIHVCAGAVAIAMNLYCVRQVIGRYRAASGRVWRMRDRRIRISAIGIPFALVALIAGFALAGH